MLEECRGEVDFAFWRYGRGESSGMLVKVVTRVEYDKRKDIGWGYSKWIIENKL